MIELLAGGGPIPDGSNRASAPLPDRIGHYRLLGKLGEGGMGVVYTAEDERLGRKVALKVMRCDSGDPAGRARLQREARIAAAISHPHICQIFELGEWEGQPFLALELLAGKPLAERLAQGALPPAEALQIGTAIVEALAVLHQHGVVHRDLKPSNIFLTPNGVKLLDFGMARPLAAMDTDTQTCLTQAGTFLGTPAYAAPEQWSGGTVDTPADLFSAGVILFEMLSGRRPFQGATFAAIADAVLHQAPPVLTGSSGITALDRILYRALAKRPEDRYRTAEGLAADLRAIAPIIQDDSTPEVRAVLRLAVLPFRPLRPDPELAYVGPGLAEALISELSGLESLVVRSSARSGRFGEATPDLDVIAVDLAVDAVVTGSFVRQRDQLRVSAELLSVPSGDRLWTGTRTIAVDSVFDLPAEFARPIVAALPLTAGDRARPAEPRPSNPKAYELYVRGLQLRMESSSWRQARSNFEQCLASDPEFVPALAELGRIERVLGKYEDPTRFAEAERALSSALKLAPDNGAAHHYLAQLEIDLGRIDAALSRLLGQVRQRRADPQIYAALVQACRYAGLLEESVAAHHQARRLDPSVSTSVLHTFYALGDFTSALEEAHRTSDPVEARLLGAMGKTAEAIAVAGREEDRFYHVPRLRSFCAALRLALEGRNQEAIRALDPLTSTAFPDGEGLFYIAEIYAVIGQLDEAAAMLHRAVDAGYLCLPAFQNDPYLAPLRSAGRMDAVAKRIEEMRAPVVERFQQAGGRALLALGGVTGQTPDAGLTLSTVKHTASDPV